MDFGINIGTAGLNTQAKLQELARQNMLAQQQQRELNAQRMTGQLGLEGFGSFGTPMVPPAGPSGGPAMVQGPGQASVPSNPGMSPMPQQPPPQMQQPQGGMQGGTLNVPQLFGLVKQKFPNIDPASAMQVVTQAQALLAPDAKMQLMQMKAEFDQQVQQSRIEQADQRIQNAQSGMDMRERLFNMAQQGMDRRASDRNAATDEKDRRRNIERDVRGQYQIYQNDLSAARDDYKEAGDDMYRIMKENGGSLPMNGPVRDSYNVARKKQSDASARKDALFTTIAKTQQKNPWLTGNMAPPSEAEATLNVSEPPAAAPQAAAPAPEPVAQPVTADKTILIDQAKAAIAAGADPLAVKARLQKMGVDAGGL